MINAILGPLHEPYFQKALIGGSLIAMSCGLVGCYVILRRMAFLGDALSHAMLAGVTIGYLLMQTLFRIEAHAGAMLLGAVIAAVVTVGLIGLVSRGSRIKEDTAIGIMYTGVFAVGGAVASMFSHRIHVDLLHFIMGNVLAITDADLWVAAFVACLVLTLVIVFHRPLQVTSFDPVMAAAIGVPVLLVDYLLTVCTSFVVVSGVSMVGVVLVVGLLVTPAATAYLLCDRLSRMLVLAALFGVTSIIGGLYFALWLNVAGGAAIVLFSTFQFLVVLAVAPRYGMIAHWLRRRNIIPQQHLEDILGFIMRAKGQPVLVAELERSMPFDRHSVRRSVQSMKKQELVETAVDGLRLTDKGSLEARRLQRAHRLWEAYLVQAESVLTDDIHPTADRLEHINDETTVSYLDHKLGHPLFDPHGSAIPQDPDAVSAGKVVRASMLREPAVGVIESVDEDLQRMGLQEGTRLKVGAREQNGAVWTFTLPTGIKISLDHRSADGILVRVE